MKIELTEEQSQHLIELGVDPKLASKCNMVMGMGTGVRGITKRTDPKPIFTLTNLLKILPKEIKDHIGTYGIRIENEIPEWTVYYVDYGDYVAEPYSDSIFITSELIDALYQLLIWVIEHNYYNS